MNGCLLIDKPSGPTSHDVVARLRKTSGERRMGHTGTLDPRASGLLVLVTGNATRLATFLSGHDKTYDAIVELGSTRDTDDADGVETSRSTGSLPGDDAIDAAIAAFGGAYDQLPPQHSAKRVAGVKAYEFARRDEPVELKAVPVTVRSIARTASDGPRISLRVTATSGFYVRSLARDLGARLGCGAHLAELRRTHVGRFSVADAVPMDVAERAGADIASRALTASEILSDWPEATVNALGLTRVLHGNPLAPVHLVEGTRQLASAGTSSEPVRVRILDADGRLIAVGEARGGALHPVVVLG